MVNQGTLYLSLLVATFAVSWAAVLIKLADASPLPIAFYRMGMAALILAIPALPKMRQTFRILTRKQIGLLVLSGIVLGLHFAFWVTSLFYTTISNSTILVATQPIFILAMEAAILKDKIPVRSVVGMVVAIIGMAVISRGDLHLGKEYIIGDILALIGAFCAGTYLFIGRQLRARIDNLGYILPVYTISALTLLIISLAYGENMTDYPARSWIIFLLLAIIPTVLGHSLYNWLLKYVPAHMVATTILGEPIGATILAIFFFNQIPGWWTVVGGALILSGIFVVLSRGKEKMAVIAE
ncbi:MAG: DMT family transporter [candidate division Zixibacteria bacterium]|nr:DMT family transporter [candidate division Zixibacteria bacterium]